MVDYSKWKDIEISDDEDDTHPNIDTPSLFRWRHQARVERMEEKQKDLDRIKEEKAKYDKEVKTMKEKLSEAKEAGGVGDMSKLKQALNDLEKKGDNLVSKQKDLEKKEKASIDLGNNLEPWNVDTISSEGFSKTLINQPPPLKTDELTEEEKEKRMKEFVKKNEANIKKYGMYRSFDESRRFLMDHPELACEDTANYLVVWCINLEMEDKHELMSHVSHQTICMQFILELAKQLDRDPRSCVSAFFHRIQQAEPEYKKAFTDELEAFKDRIRKRAAQKLEEMVKEAEEEERQNRLGPGGLDPIEVMETLPEGLQECFTTQNVELLQGVIEKMDPEEAKYHMKRCVDSGLWVPNAGDSADKAAE
ncbi:Hsp90 co-chaperone Cdc37 [Chionoecetes opilio]|uniref:Hsp90 co-chaperone Cdc37 n=1 Tax=Chionoecetes opilio TaxID=41210 RepID=A0A8J5CTC8_CHIOP|nr:Hsp90 co-chaperone Cdc37 [Chionoecetes opilio]